MDVLNVCVCNWLGCALFQQKCITARPGVCAGCHDSGKKADRAVVFLFILLTNTVIVHIVRFATRSAAAAGSCARGRRADALDAGAAVTTVFV